MLKTARRKTFAHTGIYPAHLIYVLPPGAYHETGNATVGRIPYDSQLVGEIAALCDLQAERAAGVISDFVARLYGYREWPEGTMFHLDFPARESPTASAK
jgi:hypothetical protein